MTTKKGASVAHLTYGPCAFRAAHWHAFSWEVLSPTAGGPLLSVMQSPAEPGKLRRDVVAVQQSFAIPQGWLHYQLNDNCAFLFCSSCRVCALVAFGCAVMRRAPHTCTHAHLATTARPQPHPRAPPQKGYNTTAVLVWNAVASGGVVNAAAALDAFPSSYTGAAFVEPLPPAAGFWARDAVCAKRCKLA